MRIQIKNIFNYLTNITIWVIVLNGLVVCDLKGDQTLLNCAEISDGVILSPGIPKTKEEEILQLESQYFNQLSKFAPCSTDDRSTATNDNSKTSGLTGSASDGADADVNSQSSTDKINELERISQQKAEDSIEKVKSISNNLKSNEYGSLSIDSEGHQILEGLDSDFSKDMSEIPEVIPNGSMHSELKNVDNIKILKEQLRERAEKETDPQVKESLMKRYEEL